LTIIVVFVYSYHDQTVHGHDFSTTDESTLITLVEQIKAQTQLVITGFLSNDNSSAYEHARKAAVLMKDLENNITQTDPTSSDITQVYEQGQKNSTTLALVVANIVDDILRKYGSAFAVGYDMTNMSNMMMNSSSDGMDMTSSMNTDMIEMQRTDDSTSSHSMDMMMITTNVTNGDSSSMIGGHSNTSRLAENDLVLVNTNDYETAKVLSSNIKDLYITQLRPRSLVNETANLDKLEDGLSRMEQAVNMKALPEAMMDVAHIQIHPMLQRIYDLQLQQRNAMTESMSMD